MAAVPLYCVCRQPYDVSRFMIECDICKDWFHGRYVAFGVSRRRGSVEARNAACFPEKGDGLSERLLTGSQVSSLAASGGRRGL